MGSAPHVTCCTSRDCDFKGPAHANDLYCPWCGHDLSPVDPGAWDVAGVRSICSSAACDFEGPVLPGAHYCPRCGHDLLVTDREPSQPRRGSREG